MKKQTKYNLAWSSRQFEKGLCRFCKNVRLENQKTCAICYLKILAKNGLNNRDHGEKLYLKLIEQNYKCYLTGRDLTLGLNASIDHVISRSVNKNLRTDINNIKWCDKDINRIKSDLTYEQLINVCKEIINYHEKNNQ